MFCPKLAVKLAPPEPELQHAALPLTARGWETGTLPAPDGSGSLAIPRPQEVPWSVPLDEDYEHAPFAYPAPVDISRGVLSPAAARWDEALGGFILDWDDFRTAADPHAVAVEFARSAFRYACAVWAGMSRCPKAPTAARHPSADGLPPQLLKKVLPQTGNQVPASFSARAIRATEWRGSRWAKHPPHHMGSGSRSRRWARANEDFARANGATIR
jgi:hypothetical protein